MKSPNEKRGSVTDTYSTGIEYRDDGFLATVVNTRIQQSVLTIGSPGVSADAWACADDGQDPLASIRALLRMLNADDSFSCIPASLIIDDVKGCYLHLAQSHCSETRDARAVAGALARAVESLTGTAIASVIVMVVCPSKVHLEDIDTILEGPQSVMTESATFDFGVTCDFLATEPAAYMIVGSESQPSTAPGPTSL
ncbi:hypothetical protein [Bifidobacterium pseudolongum]|jgi:hypothetical protein|uniref:hypothetical protein n=1 Tax=Bifidobacterium pseudolongum TaxID=1694 RepID=UPI0011C1110C|nr:hypothetical protein [Bifidobacterium pseudolongum]